MEPIPAPRAAFAGSTVRGASRGPARTATVVFVTAGLVVLAAACGGSTGGHVAQLGSTTTPPALSSGSTNAGGSTSSQLLAFARCMRANGVPSFPDPDSSGKLPNATVQQLGVSNSRYQAATRTCQHLLPNGSNGPTPAQVQLYRNTMLIYARCMRAHGLNDFPDPDSRGRLDIGPGTDVPVDTPQFQTAFRACKHLLSYYESP